MPDPVTAQRLTNQRLAGPQCESAVEVVGWLGAVQSQDFHGAKWAVGQRMTNSTDATLEAAFNTGEILRTHVLRPTWHFVTPEDIRWMLALTAPRVHALNAYMYRQQELDAEVLTRAESAITEELSNGSSLTRNEIGALLGGKGIVATGMRLGYIMMHAELEALICSGALKGKQHTYALLEERVAAAPGLSREETLAALVHRFFRSHGPATKHDFAWWSGLTIADAKLGIHLAASDLDQVTIGDTTVWSGAIAGTVALESPLVHLLPNYDEYLTPRDDRVQTGGLGPERMREILAAGRMDGHHIVIDGQLRGGWRRQLSTKSVRLDLDPFDGFSDDENAALERAAASYGNFLDRAIAIS